MFLGKSEEKITLDQIPEKIDRVAYIIDMVLNSFDYSAAAGLLSHIAERSKYKSEIPTTKDKIKRYIELTIEGVYKRIFKNQKSVFGDISDEAIKEKFYPLIKTYFEKADDKLVVKSGGETGKAEMGPLLAELYGITPDSKIILATKDSPLSLEVSVRISEKLKPLSLSLHPEDAKLLFGWDEIPPEFNSNKYRGNYSIERVVKKVPEKPPEKEISLERIEKRVEE